jgi:hypothetical protein
VADGAAGTFACGPLALLSAIVLPQQSNAAFRLQHTQRLSIRDAALQ